MDPRTALLLLRIRYLLREETGGAEPVESFAEEIVLAACRDEDGPLRWLEPIDRAGRELANRAEPVANMPPPEKRDHVAWALDLVGSSDPWSRPVIEHRVTALADAHARLRRLTKAPRLEIHAHEPPDVMGCFVLVPTGTLMAHVAIIIEGGLFSADLLERLASRPEEVPGQRPADFGLDGARLSEEIQATFSEVQGQRKTSRPAAPATRAAPRRSPATCGCGRSCACSATTSSTGAPPCTPAAPPSRSPISPATRRARRRSTSSLTTRSSIAGATPAGARTRWSRTT